MRLAIQSQMMRYLGAISDCFPEGTRLSLPHGGLSVWIELPQGTDAFALQKAALKQGIGICPGHIFSTSDLYHHYIRLNFSPLWSPKIQKGIKTLAQLV
jgi:DNA-binding transcriptional MocR family regulator